MIKFIDPQLKSDDVATEVHYLVEDLRDLDGMNQIRFEPISDINGVAEVRVGVQFEAHPELLASILRRLRDRLYYAPIETAFTFQLGEMALHIETHQAEDLVGLMAIAQSGLLFSPERDYLAEAETYSRTQGELSPTELDNLNLLRQRLDLSVDEATVLNARAAGPFQTQADKRRYFEEITSAEFSRLRAMHEGQPFALKDPWPVLQELAENLSLPILEAEAIYQQYQQRYNDDIQIKTTQTTLKTTEDVRLAAEAKAEGDRQKQAHQAQVQRDQYQALCHQALANSLYPSEFDQGRLDQARRLQGLSLDEAIAIEAAVRDQKYGPIESALGVDYTRLRSLLVQQAWQAADLETEAAIFKALNLDMQPVTAATVERLLPTDLATIDALWSLHSNRRFGFKAQQQVYRSQQQIQQDEHLRGLDFQQALGWRDQPTWLYRGHRPYYALDFSLEAPPGHLPTWRWCCPSLNHRYDLDSETIIAVMSHLNTCLPLEAVATPVIDQTLIPGEVTSVS
ncbi:GUN4 domain-containing protein [Nodosilinea sp. E11]|nr:GUN4 domain-containing protein [Nodosilinea sp. E11]